MLGSWCLLVRRMSSELCDWPSMMCVSFQCYLHTYQWNGDRLVKRTKCSPLRKYKIYIKLHHQSFSPFRAHISARWWISWQDQIVFPKSLILWPFGVLFLRWYCFKSISYSHQELNLPLLPTCLLSLWLIPQLSCYHLASVKSFEMKWWWWHPEMPVLQGDSSAGHRSVNIYYLHYNLQFAR